MAYTAVSEQQVAGPYLPESATAKLTTLTFAACDIVNGNRVVMSTGRALVMFQNTDVGAVTVTISSSPDDYGRKADITAFSIAASAFVARIFEPKGWEQTAGGRDLVIMASDVDLKVLAIPL